LKIGWTLVATHTLSSSQNFSE